MDAPLPSGWMPGDRIAANGTCQRSKQVPLVGIVHLTNRTRYGFSSRGVPLYLFYPLDAGYPPMIVGSKASTSTNQFGVALFESWDTGKSKWPRAALQRLLGPVGSPEIEMAALKQRICIPDSPSVSTLSYTFPTDDVTPQTSWDVSFNIDPAGCRDVDDAISWRTLDSQHPTVEFAIHIADVSQFVGIQTPLDDSARRHGQTVYFHGKPCDPMLPAVLSEDTASLLSDGKARPTLALIWTLQQDSSGAWKAAGNPQFRCDLLANQQTFSYDTIHDSPHAAPLRAFLEAIWGVCLPPEDSHKWIEVAMILYNRHVARILAANGRGLLRRHAGISSAAFETLAFQTGCPEIAWLGYSAGEYTSGAAAEADSDSVAHAGLGEAVYCHATSPLRRYADLVNQRALKGILFGYSLESSEPERNLEELAAILNDREKAVKAFEREVWCLESLRSNEISETEGFILGWKQSAHDPTSVRVSIYCPLWKRTVKVGFFWEAATSDEEICLKPRDSSAAWIANRGQKVRVRAFTDLRSAQWSERFVFSCLPFA